MLLSPPLPGADATQLDRVSQCLDAILMTPYAEAAPCFDYLEESGLFLGNGGFLLAMLLTEQSLAVPGVQQQAFCNEALDALRQHLGHRQTLVFLYGGRLYCLLCFPRLTPGSPSPAESVLDGLSTTQQALPQPCLILLSQLFFGEQNLFWAASSLCRAKEYCSFRQVQSGLIQVQPEEQLVFTDVLTCYQNLASQVVSELAGPHTDTAQLSQLIFNTILSRCGASMESVRQHFQLAAHVLTEALIETVSISTTFFDSDHASRPFPGFETQQELLETLHGFLEALHETMHHRQDHEIRSKMLEIRRYIDENIQSYELSVRFLSEHFEMSPSRLNANFKKYYGQQLSSYLRATRLQYAQRLILAHEDWSMQEIAAASGYNDVSTMYRTFQTIAGVTPARFRMTPEIAQT